MTVAFTPHDRPPRLTRFVDEALPGENTICVLDFEQNLLLINRQLYDQLGPATQREVLRTNEPALALVRPDSQAAEPQDNLDDYRRRMYGARYGT
jgi:hypothetical protein